MDLGRATSPCKTGRCAPPERLSPRTNKTVLETDRVDMPYLMLVGANFLHCILPLTAVSTGENGRMKMERGAGSWLADEGED